MRFCVSAESISHSPAQGEGSRLMPAHQDTPVPGLHSPACVTHTQLDSLHQAVSGRCSRWKSLTLSPETTPRQHVAQRNTTQHVEIAVSGIRVFILQRSVFWRLKDFCCFFFCCMSAYRPGAGKSTSSHTAVRGLPSAQGLKARGHQLPGQPGPWHRGKSWAELTRGKHSSSPGFWRWSQERTKRACVFLYFFLP